MWGRSVWQGALLLLIQMLLSFFVVGLLLPALLAKLPSLRGPGVGPWLALGIAAAVFILLRLVWPRSKRD